MADCTYTVPDLEASGDALYGPRVCNQPFIDYSWYNHGFNGDYWQDGWGFDDPCNITKPLARTFNAMWLLAYSAEDWQNESWDSDPLHWGSRYVRQQLGRYGDLRAQCGDGTANARTTGCQRVRKMWRWGCTKSRDESYRSCREWHWLFAWLCFVWVWVVHKVCVASGWIADVFCSLWYGTVGGGQHLDLYLPFFFPIGGVSGNATVVERAGTLIHESRHIGNHPHDGVFPPGMTYPAGKEGADSSWEYEGGWMYHALYLWWFYAEGTRTSILQREAAKAKANTILANCFEKPTGLVIP